jgi:hypothetical protein
MPAPPLTNEQLQQAIAAYQGANAPAPAPMAVDPAAAPPAVDPTAAPAPVEIPPVQEAVQPPPVVDAALPPSAPNTYVPEPAPQNSRQALGQLNAAADTQAQATQQATQAETQANTAEADLLARQRAEEATAQAKEAKAHAAGVEKVKGLFDQYQSFKSQNANLQAKDSRTTTQRVMGILGKAIGGIADGLSGFSGKQTNFAGDIEKSINDSVDKDIAHQQAAIEGKNKQAAEMLTDLGLARKFFVDDPDAAAAYAKSQRKEMYANSLAELSKRSANPKIQAEGTAAAAKIKQDALQDQAQIYASKENAVYAAQAANSRIATTNPESPYEGMTQAQLQAIKDAGQLPAAGQKVLNNLVTGDNVQGAVARNPEVIAQTKGAKLSEDQVVRDPAIAVQYAKDADKFQKGVDTVRTMNGLIDAIKADRKLFDVAERAKDAVGMSAIGSRLESNGKTLTLEGKNAYELGALSGPDVGLINSVTGNVKSFTEGADTQLESMGTNITKSVNQKAFSRGLEHPFPVATPKPTPQKPKGAPGKGSVPESKSAATVSYMLNGSRYDVPAGSTQEALLIRKSAEKL